MTENDVITFLLQRRSNIVSGLKEGHNLVPKVSFLVSFFSFCFSLSSLIVLFEPPFIREREEGFLQTLLFSVFVPFFAFLVSFFLSLFLLPPLSLFCFLSPLNLFSFPFQANTCGEREEGSNKKASNVTPVTTSTVPGTRNQIMVDVEILNNLPSKQKKKLQALVEKTIEKNVTLLGKLSIVKV